MTLTKSDLIDSLYNNCGLSKRRSSNLLESILEIFKSTLATGEDVLISGFGKFCINEKNERRGRNPATGEDLNLNARRVLTFTCSDRLRVRINGK